MAGATNGVFHEKTSPFLREKLAGTSADFLRRQYLVDPAEPLGKPLEVDRHYHSEVEALFEGRVLRGVEKLYRRTVLVEPTSVCAAHCRWCIRGQYDTFTLGEDELELIARYCGTAPENAEVREVLVTGGDPLMLVKRLDFLLDALERHAPNVEVVRIGTRVPLQDPRRVDARMVRALRPRSGFRIEIATHVNHPGELFPEVREAYRRLSEAGVTLYDQTVLLRGVNDDLGTLVDLVEELRGLRIEMHYLFHCVPIRGMDHHRTTLDEGLRLARRLTSSGLTSGRAKPMFTVMTDIGKITLYEGTILERDDRGRVLLASGYSYEDRLRWTPGWQLPDNAHVGDDGLLRVWYLDSSAAAAPLPAVVAAEEGNR
ncbi:radical SAM protein [Streptomyces sp. ML-6]|uniref:radical SAM protein n=1 Tax=Streptomyces sp. ML-6 TaxID=2982693 RepID=UPI0024C02343|nr:radical SAM protein [Streptomyces sp. ML-6]MDK0524146.1 radical SAM protein [Streptomyces sp. ML-6]